MDNAGRGPHRRVPSSASTRTAADGQRNALVMAHDEQDTFAFKQQDAAPPSMPSRASTKITLQRCIALVAFICLSVLLAAPFTGFHPRDLVFSSSSHHHEEQVGIPLHPENHRSRPPKTQHYDWTITTGLRRPDGVQKEVYLVNGQFPGPTIEARSGDRIVVHVRNRLEDEGVSLHWHGLRMKGNNTMDGAVGITQCPVPSGKDFTYDFTIGDDEHGTFWWHSHHSVQRGDGLFGGLVVHKPAAESSSRLESEVDEVLVLVGDWFHQKQADVLSWYGHWSSMGNEPVPDSLHINGHGRFICSMAVPARPVDCRDKALADMKPIFRKMANQTRLRVVNVGTIAGISLMVDGATLNPIEVEGGCAVKSDEGDAAGILYPGERMDMIMSRRNEATGAWFNVYLDDENFALGNPSLVEHQSFPALPETLHLQQFQRPKPLAASGRLIDLAQLTANSVPSSTIVSPAQETILFYIKTMIKAQYDNRPKGFINHTSWQPQQRPLLSQARSTWDANQLLPFIRSDAENPVDVDVVINNLDDGSHPIHMHGHSFHVLSSYRADGRDGWGSYNPFDSKAKPPNPLNLHNPIRRDTISVPRRGHVVLRFTADNPGLWMLHCHMMVHLGTGMAAGFHVGPVQDQKHEDAIEQSAAQLCAA